MDGTDGKFRELGREPCPVCGHKNRCKANPARNVILCFRETAGLVNGFRRAKYNGECSTYVNADADPPITADPTDWERKAGNYSAALSDARLAALAANLHVAPEALKRIEAGWSKHLHCYTFPERDARGRVIGIATRRPSDGAKRSLRGSKRGLILPAGLDKTQTLLIVEGATDAAAALTVGLQAVGRPSAKGGIAHLAELLSDWAGDVVVVGERDQKPDGDWPGRDGAMSVAMSLAVRLGRSLRWALPPEDLKDLCEGVRREVPDLADAKARTAAGARILDALQGGAEAVTGTSAYAASDDVTDSPSKKSQATKLVELVEALESRVHCCGVRCVELWHAGDVAYATFAVGEHVETWPLRSKGFKRWLSREFHRNEGRAPSAQPIQDALAVLDGKALFDGPEREVFVRLGWAGETLYVDLCDAAWCCAEVSGDGWRVIPASEAPVRFRRSRGMLALPEPKRGGSLEELRAFVNVADAEAFILIEAWLIGALQPRGPYPLLCLNGEQGSAKSFTSRVLRRLIDPNEAELRSEPRDERDLAIAGNNGWLIALDNLSHVPAWRSDALCRLATGGGFTTRELYSDGDETIFTAKRPILVNGIEEVVTRPDLLDRAIVATLPSIPEGNRRPEAELWAAFDAARPRLLGALLSAVSAALRERGRVRLHRLPRMADFAVWVCAAEQGCGVPWERGDFLAAYAGNRAAAVEAGIEASPVGPALLAWLEGRTTWTGTATDLLAELDAAADDRSKWSRGWPGSGRALSDALRRLAPSLRARGVDVIWLPRTKRGRVFRIVKTGETPSPSSPPSPIPAGGTENADLAGKRVTVGDVGVTVGDETARPDRHPGNPSDATEHAEGDGGDEGDGVLQFHIGGSGAHIRDPGEAGDWGDV